MAVVVATLGLAAVVVAAGLVFVAVAVTTEGATLTSLPQKEEIVSCNAAIEYTTISDPYAIRT